MFCMLRALFASHCQVQFTLGHFVKARDEMIQIATLLGLSADCLALSDDSEYRILLCPALDKDVNVCSWNCQLLAIERFKKVFEAVH